LKITIEIVDLPCKHVDFPSFFVGLPETKWRQDEDFTAFYGLPGSTWDEIWDDLRLSMDKIPFRVISCGHIPMN
jgi:hypothetical protein